MANNLAQRQQKQQEARFLEIRNLSGLSLKLEPRYRPKNTFQQLDNFNLDTEGSITKVNSTVVLSSGANQIVDAVEFSPSPNGSNLKIIGYSITDRRLYDVLGSAPSIVLYADTSALITGPNTAIPFMGQLPGILIPYNIRSWIKSTAYSYFDAVIKYSAADGNLYVYYVTTPASGAGTANSGTVEPIWPASGSVSEGGTPPAFSIVPGGTTTDGPVVWTCKGNATWVASTGYIAGNYIIDSNGNIEKLFVPGTSGLLNPIWNTHMTGITHDNTAEWECLLMPGWVPDQAVALGYAIIDQNGNIQVVTTAGTTSFGSGLVWTNAGLVSGDTFRTNYLVVSQQGNQPIKVTQYLKNNIVTLDVSQIGVSAPEEPIDAEEVTITPNLNGLTLQAGRAFVWTFYNPRTLHESSPSPFSGPTKITESDRGGKVVVLPGSLLPPLPSLSPAEVAIPSDQKSYQTYSLGVPVSALTPKIGTDFTHVRFYASKDGTANFFLLTNLLDATGNPISSSDGSVLISQLIAAATAAGTLGYVPLPTPQSAVPQVRVYDGGGPVNLIPDPANFGPVNWSPGNGGDVMTVVPGDAPDGQAAIEYAGTGAVSKNANYRSTAFDINNGGSYVFSGYLDNAAGNTTISWRIISPDGNHVWATFSQPAGSVGTVTGTWTASILPYAQARLQAHMPAGTNVPIGSILVWADPILEVGSVLSTITPTYPQPDEGLIIPAPAFGINDPPPVCAGIGGILQSSLFLFTDADRTKLVYSLNSDFESFPTTYFQYLPSGPVVDPGMAIEATYDRLIIGRQRSIFQGTGAAPAFAIQPVDARHGLMAYRGIAATGSSLIAWLIDGLAQIGMGLNIPSPSQIGVGYSSEQLVGDPILPLLQTAMRAYLAYNNQKPGIPQFAISDVTNDLFLLFKVNP